MTYDIEKRYTKRIRNAVFGWIRQEIKKLSNKNQSLAYHFPIALNQCIIIYFNDNRAWWKFMRYEGTFNDTIFTKNDIGTQRKGLCIGRNQLKRAESQHATIFNLTRRIELDFTNKLQFDLKITTTDNEGFQEEIELDGLQIRITNYQYTSPQRKDTVLTQRKHFKNSHCNITCCLQEMNKALFKMIKKQGGNPWNEEMQRIVAVQIEKNNISVVLKRTHNEEGVKKQFNLMDVIRNGGGVIWKEFQIGITWNYETKENTRFEIQQKINV